MDRDSEIIAFFASANREIKRSDVCVKFGVSEPTASRWLDSLLSKGLIVRSGSGRSVSYSLDPADLYLTKKQLSGDDADIQYDFNRLHQYVPGVSSYFTPEQKSALMEASVIPMGMTHDDYIASIQRKILLEASWASSALEGNTYSLVDTEELFDFGREKVGAKAEEALMLLNHKHAIEYVLGNIEDISICRRDILNIHALLSDGLLKDPADSGRVRFNPVRIGQSTYRPLDINNILSEQIDILVEQAKTIQDRFDQSFYLLINIAYLQPFADVNKRTSRVASNIPLLKSGLIPMSFFQMSKVGYEKGILHYYETGDFRRLAKEFVSCYQSSALRFREIFDNKPTPDQMRLRGLYKKEISRIVRSVVMDGNSVDSAANEIVPESSDSDKNFLCEYAEKVVSGLNEGNIILYGLTDEDLAKYRNKTQKAKP